MITIYCQIKAIQQSQYTLIIADDLSRTSIDDLKYVAVTLLPNWQHKHIELDEIGYLTFDSVSAGDKFFNRDVKEYEIYKYSANYLISFVPEQKKIKMEQIKLD